MNVNTYHCRKTNISETTKAYEYLSEINKRLGKEKLVVTVTNVIDGAIFRRNRKMSEYYSIYWDLGNCKYKQVEDFRNVGYDVVESYLLSTLIKMDAQKGEYNAIHKGAS